MLNLNNLSSINYNKLNTRNCPIPRKIPVEPLLLGNWIIYLRPYMTMFSGAGFEGAEMEPGPVTNVLLILHFERH
jgi:hypothetical protein